VLGQHDPATHTVSGVEQTCPFWVGSATQVPPLQVWHWGQFPQFRTPPHRSEMLPQLTPWAAQVVGAQQVLLLVQIWPLGQQNCAPLVSLQMAFVSQQEPLRHSWVEEQAAPVPHTQLPVPSLAEQVLP
jgi:hypothetical protein